MSTTRLELLTPEWPVAARVRACTTLRTGGVSEGPFATLNLAHHVGDRADHVAENRRRLRTVLGLPGEPLWLAQVHGTAVARAGDGRGGAPADAAVASAPGEVCAVLTADCLPVVLADRDATRVAVAHAGWRGLAAGVIEATLEALDRPPERLVAWLGPAISQPAFEVGEEVRAAFLVRSPEYAAAFAGNPRGRFQADLYTLARITLARLGLTSIHGGGWCTAREPARFFSYRRDGTTGRMATLVWLA
jgi:YfiH family protein